MKGLGLLVDLTAGGPVVFVLLAIQVDALGGVFLLDKFRGVLVGIAARRFVQQGGGLLCRSRHSLTASLSRVSAELGRGVIQRHAALLGDHVQPHGRAGQRIGHRRALGGALFRQSAHTGGVRRPVVDGIHRLRRFRLHQQHQGIQRIGADGVHHGVLNAALLDAHIHNIAGIVGQRQIAPGLHDEQGDHGNAAQPMLFIILEYFEHSGFLSRFYGRVAGIRLWL